MAEENRLEGQHAGDGQQHRRILRHQGGAGQYLMAPLGVEIQKSLPDGGTGEGWRHGQGKG
jgi:hypothetical protein